MEKSEGMSRRIVSDEQLAPYAPGEALVDRVQALLLQQHDAWDLARKGYDGLQAVRVRTFLFDGFVVKVQYNPGRLVSTTSKTDPVSVGQRPCFLCEQNLPPDQQGIPYGDDYMILVNPYPIFNEHFTIVHRDHRPQRIAGSFGALVALTRELGQRYVLLYNGPRSGASAPDHHHFQAGDRSFIPIDFDYAAVKERFGRPMHTSAKLTVTAVDGYLRPFIAIESEEEDAVTEAFDRIYERWTASTQGPDEPMMNVLIFLDGSRFRALVFPRTKHRPSHFYREGEDRIIISPGAVDLGGTCTIPTRESFERITREDIVEIFSEVCPGPDQFAELTGRMEDALRAL